jgi:hypothetical protein
MFINDATFKLSNEREGVDGLVGFERRANSDLSMAEFAKLLTIRQLMLKHRLD